MDQTSFKSGGGHFVQHMMLYSPLFVLTGQTAKGVHITYRGGMLNITINLGVNMLVPLFAHSCPVNLALLGNYMYITSAALLHGSAGQTCWLLFVCPNM